MTVVVLRLSRLSGSSTNQRVGCSIPGSSGLHVEMSLCKILNPKLIPMTMLLVCECVCLSSWWAGQLFVEKSLTLTLPLLCECVNADLCCKSALSSWRTRKVLYKYSPFTISSSTCGSSSRSSSYMRNNGSITSSSSNHISVTLAVSQFSSCILWRVYL